MSRFKRWAVALSMATLGGASLAATAFPAEAAGGGMYPQQGLSAPCASGLQDRAACVREAGAARQAAAQGQLTSAPDYTRNALARCESQPAADRSACEARVLGVGNTDIQGSVLGGGLIRETVTPLTITPVTVR
ncbi:MAG: hypothetical protein ABWZ88_10040 [Variovorax sp.]